MERLETEWKKYAVLYIDLNTVQRGKPESLNQRFEAILSRMEKEWGVTQIADSYPVRFENVIHTAYERTGRQIVILVDEYDKPLLSMLECGEKTDKVREKLKAFYSVLKSEDRYIRFAMLTGVTCFSKVSVFSDLNNLKDISMSRQYAGICGISEEELHSVFDEQVGELAAANRMTKEEAYAELRRRYDGYHFAYDTPGMYNPFSVLNTLCDKTFNNYWFATGTPSFLIDVIKNTDFDLEKGFAEPISETELADVDSIEYNPVPILFQSGYLTIKDYEAEFRTYTLDFPNTEVREGFMSALLPRCSYAGRESTASVFKLVRAVRNGDTAGMVMVFKTLFDQRGNYMLYTEKSKERDFRNIVYMIFSFLDIYCSAELCTAAGRMDISVETKDYIYVIELKIDKTAEAALQQIKDMGYANKFLGDKRQLILLGVNFSTKTNSIDDWTEDRVQNGI